MLARAIRTKKEANGCDTRADKDRGKRGNNSTGGVLIFPPELWPLHVGVKIIHVTGKFASGSLPPMVG
jgi:hypothetical protein